MVSLIRSRCGLGFVFNDLYIFHSDDITTISHKSKLGVVFTNTHKPTVIKCLATCQPTSMSCTVHLFCHWGTCCFQYGALLCFKKVCLYTRPGDGCSIKGKPVHLKRQVKTCRTWPSRNVALMTWMEWTKALMVMSKLFRMVCADSWINASKKDVLRQGMGHSKRGKNMKEYFYHHKQGVKMCLTQVLAWLNLFVWTVPDRRMVENWWQTQLHWTVDAVASAVLTQPRQKGSIVTSTDKLGCES